MAFSFPKLYIHTLISMTFFFLLLDIVKSDDSISFTYPNFLSGTGNLVFNGDAINTNGTLQLTKTNSDGTAVRQRAGQALFSEEIHLWDTTGRVASFYTSFTFLVRTTAKNPADGFAFFLAPPNVNVKRFGGLLGLFDIDTATDKSKNQVVAVEFDSWVNEEWNDPSYRHIAIDVNSIYSVAYKKWEDNDFFSGATATAHISYDAKSQILTAVLSYPNGGDYTLSHFVDLTTALPEKVRVGFSGATGQYETDYILSWHFSSTMEKVDADVKKQNIHSVV